MKENFEFEDSLAKLSFYLKLSLIDKDYDFCKSKYEIINAIVDDWITKYATNKNVNVIELESLQKTKDIFYSIPFKEYEGFYYFEYIDAYLDKIKYFLSKETSGKKEL